MKINESYVKFRINLRYAMRMQESTFRISKITFDNCPVYNEHIIIFLIHIHCIIYY